MGADLAVTIVENDVSPTVVAGTRAISMGEAELVYIVLGAPCPFSANRGYFAIWSDERIDLRALGMELSATGRACISWKSEHGGVAGYLIFERGQEVANEADAGDDYLYLPSRGVEKAFGVELGIDEESRLAYPDLLFDEKVSCFRVVPSRGEVVAEGPETIRRLLEEEMEVEPVLPLDIW